MTNVLIASLGDSPAVVTETIDALEREERIQFDTVVTIGTNDFDVRRAGEMLTTELGEYYGGRIIYIPDQLDVQELLTEVDHLSYLSRIAQWLKTYRSQNTYLSLSGGRKTMSALVAIAVQIYGAKALCHMVPQDLELEELGKVHRLSRLPKAEQQRIYHPDADAVRLVRLPLISLFPLLDDFLAALQGQADVNKQALDILAVSGLIVREVGKVKATPTGQQLLNILGDVEQLPPPWLDKRDADVIVHDHGYGGKRSRVEAYARKLHYNCPWARRVETIPYGQKPRTGIRAKHPDGRIEVDVRTGEFAAGLCIYTTAQTAGQTERVAREVERLLK